MPAVHEDKRIVSLIDELISDFSKDDIQLLKELLQQNKGYELELLESLLGYTYMEKPVPVSQFITDPYYLGLGSQIYPRLLVDLDDLFSGGYEEAILTGSIGWGKSIFAEIALLRMLYELSCYRRPQLVFGLMESSVIALVNVSTDKTNAKKVVFQGLKSMVINSPYFKEKFPYNPQILSELRFPNNVWVFPAASGETSVLGYNVYGGVMDEVNFMDIITSSKQAHGGKYDQAETLQTALIRRMKSRYMVGGKIPGILVQISSSKYPEDYTERRIVDARTDNRIFVRRYAQWDTLPSDRFCGKRFLLSLGDNIRRPEILDTEEQLNKAKEQDLDIIDVPVEYRKDFEHDVDAAIRDFAGRPTLTIKPFILYRWKVLEAMNRGKQFGLEHPFTAEDTTLQDGASFDMKKLRLPAMKKAYEAETDPNKKEELLAKYNSLRRRPRFIHGDLAVSQDSAGLAMGYVHDYAIVTRKNENGEDYNIRLPIIVIELMLRIRPPRGGEIQIADVRNLIYELRSYGYRIQKVTYDQYQCLSGDTLVNTDRGLLPLRKVVVGDVVQSRSGPKPVVNSWSFGRRPTLRLVTKDGDVLEGTHEHKVEAAVDWTWKTGKKRPIWGWKKLCDLSEGDVLRRFEKPVDVSVYNAELVGCKVQNGWRNGGPPAQIDEWEYPSSMTEDLAEWLGLVWADGQIAEDGICISVEPEDVEDAKNIVLRLFGVSPVVYELEPTCFRIDVYGRWLVRWLKQNGFEKPSIPEAVLQSSRSVKAAFLRGLFAGDGSVDRNDGKVSLSTKSNELAQQVRVVLLTEFGLESNLAVAQRGKLGDFVNAGEQFIVQIRGSRRLFYKLIGFSYRRKNVRLEEHIDRLGRSIYARVESIEVSEADVYDLEVADDPSYVANGFVSHNSKESMQQLTSSGIESGYLSADVNPEVYNAYKDALYDDRMVMYYSEIAYNETIRLEKNEKTGKVDHPANGSKDVADAVAGVCYHCVAIGKDEPSPAPSMGELYGGESLWEIEKKDFQADILI